ncbi:hypothetical protein MNBD_GAMMA09-2413 [hydrothermal vent metagenome]|uniref:Uncharacterized protein n=1 Tax=hydrothermal vent metagenome TaxID=652676 RepID=A0A3B0XKI4_9ZZZZ
MSEISYAEQIKRLSNDYYHNHLGFEEYRSQRKVFLDKIDEEFNGRKVEAIADEPEVEEFKNSEESSLLSKTIALFKSNENE